MTSTPPQPTVRKTPAARRDEIRSAARAIALQEGLASVTLRAIATRIGVVSGLVAHYSPNMDTLVAETFSWVVERELDDVRALLSTTHVSTDRFDLLIDTLLDSSRDEMTFVWVQAWSMGLLNEKLAVAVRTQMDAWQSLIECELVRGIELGAFQLDDPVSVAWHVLAMIDGLNAHSVVGWKDAPGRQALTKLVIAGMLRLQSD